MIKTGPYVVRLMLLILETMGAHGIIGFFGGIFIVLGCIKLSFGNILFCRKTKAEAYAQKQREKGKLMKTRSMLKPRAAHVDKDNYVNFNSLACTLYVHVCVCVCECEWHVHMCMCVCVCVCCSSSACPVQWRV